MESSVGPTPDTEVSENGNRRSPPAGFAAFSESDIEISSDDEQQDDPKGLTADAQNALGVSISKAQTRLASPLASAGEKAAALDEVAGEKPFGEDDDDAEVDDDRKIIPGYGQTDSKSNVSPRVNGSSNGTGSTALPSPWRSGPKLFESSKDDRPATNERTEAHQRRSSVGPSTAGKKMIPFGLPSLPKTSGMPNFPRMNMPFQMSFFSNQKDGAEQHSGQATKPRRANTLFSGTSSPWSMMTDGKGKSLQSQSSDMPSTEQSPSDQGMDKSRHERLPSKQTEENLPKPDQNDVYETPHIPSSDSDTPQRPRLLRRATSDGSLYLKRTLSTASSLGDDSRFEHVQEQVNSRIKAIKDSFQDSNFKLPSLPSMPRFNNLRADLAAARGLLDPAKETKPAPSPKQKSFPSAAQDDEDYELAASKNLPIRRVPPSMSGKGALANPEDFPFFAQAVEDLTGDVVILGGYRGSILRSAKPPHRQLWIPVKVGLNLRRVDLEVGLNPEDEERMEESIIASGMLTHIGPVDISRRLFKRLRASENARTGKLRIWNYGYDWRLSPHRLSRDLVNFLEGLPSNAPNVPRQQRGATVIAHSLGGLITRHAVNQRPELFAGVIYAGVPRHCVNILGPFRNGDDVLMSSRVLTAQVNFTLRTSFALLPEDGRCFFNRQTKEEYPVDFFDINAWLEHCFSPCVATPLPALTQPQGTLTNLLDSVTGSLPSLPLPGRRNSVAKPNAGSAAKDSGNGMKVPNMAQQAEGEQNALAPQMGKQTQSTAMSEDGKDSVSTLITMPRKDAIAYLRRTLAETKQFKEELHFRQDHSDQNLYPPAAVLYGKSIPTVYGARVQSREAIKHGDAYDDLAFASGDGVCLARAAMIPKGYQVVKGGRVSSTKGHVSLLGDLEGVGRCLNAIIAGRRRGIGIGIDSERST
ncbi:MAG: hypothetical protein M1819_006207 [Sarea resinae]|nr:MAG: hypothetical protein M1819_006207 [Sarea resinae]